MDFQLHIEKYLYTHFEVDCGNGVRVEKDYLSSRRHVDDVPQPVISTSSLRRESADDAIAVAKSLMDAAMIVKQIEAAMPLLEQKLSFHNKKREQRFERNKVVPKPERKRPTIDKARAKALLDFARSWLHRDWDAKFAVNSIDVSFRSHDRKYWNKAWTIMQKGRNGLEIREAGYRGTTCAQRDFISYLCDSTVGDVLLEADVRRDGEWTREVIRFPKVGSTKYVRV